MSQNDDHIEERAEGRIGGQPWVVSGGLILASVRRSATALSKACEGGPWQSGKSPLCPGPTMRPPRNDGVASALLVPTLPPSDRQTARLRRLLRPPFGGRIAGPRPVGTRDGFDF
jgi:hypothetical protein